MATRVGGILLAFALVFTAGSLLFRTSLFQTSAGGPVAAGTVGKQAAGKVHVHQFDNAKAASEHWKALLRTSSAPHHHHHHHHHFPGRNNWTAHIPTGTKPGQDGFAGYHMVSRSTQLEHLTDLPKGWTAKFAEWDGRWYLQEAPPHLSSTDVHHLPLYVVMNGRGMTPGGIAKLADLPSATGRAVLAYPTGYQYSWNAGKCCGFAQADGINDVGFITSLVKHLEATNPYVDARTVYAVGFSNGGRMAFDLACHSPGVFHGMAAVEAVPAMDCSALHPLNVEIIAQTHDPILDIANPAQRHTMDGYLEPTVLQTVAQWRHLDGCAPQATTEAFGGGTMAHTWSCANNTHLQFTLYPGGGHHWPKGTDGQPSGQQVVVHFLR